MDLRFSYQTKNYRWERNYRKSLIFIEYGLFSIKKNITGVIIQLNGVKYKLPLGWQDITIRQYQQLAMMEMAKPNKEMPDNGYQTENKLETEYLKALITVLLQCAEEDINSLSINIIQELMGLLEWLRTSPEPMDASKFIKIGNTSFGIIPDFKKITLGEWADLQYLMKTSEEIVENLHTIVAILYRPVIRKSYLRIWKWENLRIAVRKIKAGIAIKKRPEAAVTHTRETRARAYAIEKYNGDTVHERAMLFQDNVKITEVLGSLFFFALFVMKSQINTQDFLR